MEIMLHHTFRLCGHEWDIPFWSDDPMVVNWFITRVCGDLCFACRHGKRHIRDGKVCEGSPYRVY